MVTLQTTRFMSVKFCKYTNRYHSNIFSLYSLFPRTKRLNIYVKVFKCGITKTVWMVSYVLEVDISSVYRSPPFFVV